MGAGATFTLAAPGLLRADEQTRPSAADCGRFRSILEEAQGLATSPNPDVDQIVQEFVPRARQDIAVLRDLLQKFDRLESAQMWSTIADGTRAAGGSTLLVIGLTGGTAIAGVPLLAAGMIFGTVMLGANLISDSHLARVKQELQIRGKGPNGLIAGGRYGTKHVGRIITAVGQSQLRGLPPEIIEEAVSVAAARHTAQGLTHLGRALGGVMVMWDILDTAKGGQDWMAIRENRELYEAELVKIERMLDYASKPENAARMRKEAALALLEHIPEQTRASCQAPPRKKRLKFTKG